MKRKNLLSIILFFCLMFLTFYVIGKEARWTDIKLGLQQLKVPYLLAAILTSLFFVSAEGIMIWYLLHRLQTKIPFFKCIFFSFIGFFFSGITPSATGGQPMQLFYMKKSGISIANSSAVLLIIAAVYKGIIALLGMFLLLLFHPFLCSYLGKYIYLYYLGLFFNILFVFLLLFIMFRPNFLEKLGTALENFLIKLHILKPSPTRTLKRNQMICNYHQTIHFFFQHKRHIAFVFVMTFLQRCSVCFLTWLFYKGMGLSAVNPFTIMLLQAAITISVDMLPLPGAQGITEFLYQTVFQTIFPGVFLYASLCLMRGIHFYFLLIVSGIATLFYHRIIANTI